ncbi:MAG: molybdenum metabolism regulator, partial [Deltaproteobacteria bacterium]|nr:molybdenum metabolism regulator [Deltaproteobacteria bacterium]
LGIANTTWGDELAPLLVESRVVAQLESLDLSRSHLTITGMRILAAHKAKFAHLAALDVSECLLDKTGQKLAKTLCKHVNVSAQEDAREYQRDPDALDDGDDHVFRYSAVGE